MAGEGEFIDHLAVGDVKTPGDVVAGRSVIANAGVVKDRHMRLDFDSAPILKGKVLADGTTLAHAAPTGAAGDENICAFTQGLLEYHILGTQTLLGPVAVATGLNVGLDQTDNDGIEFCTGILASNRQAFVVGTDAAFYARMRFSVATIAGTDFCLFGFRKAEAYQADFNGYDEMAAFNIKAGVINTTTAINGAAVVDTDTTLTDWADAGIHELEVRVSAEGVVTYRFDGGEPTVVAAFTFDDGEVVVPFFHFLQANAAQTGALVLEEFECGHQ